MKISIAFIRAIYLVAVTLIFSACGGGGGAVVMPSISSQVMDSVVYQGQAATFSVTAQGGALSYQWYKGNQAVSGATASTYTTLSLALSDTGAQYHVVVTNSTGSIKSNIAILTVKSAPAGKINDTGITPSQCLSNDALVSCSSTTTDAQDGQVGRDITANDNTDGKAGFSFVKISSTGVELANSATAWSCVKDMTTGLMWEVKTSLNKDDTFTNYDNINTNQKYNSTTGVLEKPTQSDLDFANNSIGYIRSVNGAALCGFNDWRLPTLEELQGLVDYGSSSGPLIDTTWFPNSVNTITWSSTSSADGYAWITDFSTGKTASWARNQFKSIRLVRGALPSADRFSYALDTDGTTATIIDLHTKLIWRRCLEGQIWSGTTCSGSGTTYTFSEALARAKAEADTKIMKWRLPNAKEILSIGDNVDTLFPGTAIGNSSVWSATPYITTPSQPILMRLGWGYLDSWFTSSHVRLVRDNE